MIAKLSGATFTPYPKVWADPFTAQGFPFDNDYMNGGVRLAADFFSHKEAGSPAPLPVSPMAQFHLPGERHSNGCGEVKIIRPADSFRNTGTRRPSYWRPTQYRASGIARALPPEPLWNPGGHPCHPGFGQRKRTIHPIRELHPVPLL